MECNILLATDVYKWTHYKQYPKDTQYVYSYFESRSGAKWNETVFFGLQYFLKEYLEGCVVSKEDIDEAEDYVGKCLGDTSIFNRQGWERLLRKHSGKLPVSIKAIPEGTPIPTSNVLMTVVNTDPEFYWLTNYLESLLVQCWYASTVCTQSREMKKIWFKYLNKNGTPESVAFKLHDFGFRGVTCPEQAAIGGCAHLVNFKGTDTAIALRLARNVYFCDMAGFSIPASEHSTITSWGKEHELDAMRNMLESYPNSPIIACVSDSYDIWDACLNKWGGSLREAIMSRKGTLVVRPDSGEPVETVYKVIKALMSKFGYTANSKGYDVLPPQVRVIQGDGINFDSMEAILANLDAKGVSADNLAMGSGGGLLQQPNRDTQRFAFKCSSVCRNGTWHDVMKSPVGDSTKNSKGGVLKLAKLTGSHGGTYGTFREKDNRDGIGPDELVEVFRDGDVLKTYTLDEIRERAKL